MKLRLGARGSALSLAQAGLVARSLNSWAEVEIVKVKTTGDRLSAEEAAISWKGDFTKELDEALLERRVDFAVHSLKDVPATLPEGLALAAVPLREDPSDVLVAHPQRPFSELPRGARVGTSSPRRKAQLLAARPDLEVVEVRGNVETRIRRLREGRFDAIVLARAGLARLGRLEEISEVFSPDVLLPAVGQGALALVSRSDDERVRALLGRVDDADSHAAVLAERSLLGALDAGCRAPVAGRARVEGGVLLLTAGVFSEDGTRVLREEASGSPAEGILIGRVVAEKLLAGGAAALIRGLRP
ncbi:MAG TPA: hydroxymethylbilane synthase [Thermoanaerobaculia bacterium]|nr:hydroxymethylbilane synthase [Thermoanaerobaculia bacterium]